jgi:LysR family transcriptional activator of glutamate synthase operon
VDLQQLRSFAAVARHRHFTRAAAELHIGQPAVSQHVRRLEAELGVRLLSRTTRSVELTEAGRLLLQRCERALDELDAGVAELAELRGLVRGRLTIGAMQWLEPYDLPAALATFHDRHPAIDIRVVEEVAHTMLTAVLADQLDVAFVPIEDGVPAGLSAELLFEDELVLVVSADHPLATRSHVRVATLREEPFVFLREGTGLRRAVEDAARAAGFEPKVRFETNELSRVLALVARGLGVSAVSRAVAEAATDQVVAVSLRPALRRQVGLVWRSGRHRTPAANAFLVHVIGSQAPVADLPRHIP